MADQFTSQSVDFCPFEIVEFLTVEIEMARTIHYADVDTFTAEDVISHDRLVRGPAQERLRSFAGNSERNRRSNRARHVPASHSLFKNRSAATYQRGKRRCCSTDRGCFNSPKSQLSASCAFGIDWIRGSLSFMDKPAFRTSQRPVLEAGSSRYNTQHLHVRSAHRTAVPLGFTNRKFISELRVGHGALPICEAGAQHSQSPMDAKRTGRR